MITKQIKKLYCNLTPAEQKVADHVIEFPAEVTQMTVHQLAEKCKVASSAVIRFCKAVQLQGFSELKIALARELGSMKEAKENAVPAVIHESGAEGVVRKVFNSGMNTLRDTLDKLDFSKVEKMSQILISAKHIFIFGLGTSAGHRTDDRKYYGRAGCQGVGRQLCCRKGG